MMAGLRLMLCGDVMTGRAIDQIMPNPVDPILFESWMQSAEDYVILAERRHGPIPRNVQPEYIWGDALGIIDTMAPAVRMANLETAVTTSNDHQPKGINYRMHPSNVACLRAAQLDICTLANNHVLDWGRQGLMETLRTLRAAGIQTSGAGMDLVEAVTPAVFRTGKARILVFAGGHPDSGVDSGWAADAHTPGVYLLQDFSSRTIADIEQAVALIKTEDDIVVYSVHWGDNWGYDVPEEHQAFAHALIDDAGVDLIFGHSSHHPRGLEVYRNKLILYGCGDLINDYEGISGYEDFRPELRVLYFPVLDNDGGLKRLDMAVLTSSRFSLHRAETKDVEWLGNQLTSVCQEDGVVFHHKGKHWLKLSW